MHMVMLVLDNPGQLDALLEAWEKIGIRGVTIIESTGIHRRRGRAVPMRFLFQPVAPVEVGHYTLFVIVENEQQVQACVQAAEQVTGNLDGPNTGVLAAWPLSYVKGLPLED